MDLLDDKPRALPDGQTRRTSIDVYYLKLATTPTASNVSPGDNTAVVASLDGIAVGAIVHFDTESLLVTGIDAGTSTLTFGSLFANNHPAGSPFTYEIIGNGRHFAGTRYSYDPVTGIFTAQDAVWLREVNQRIVESEVYYQGIRSGLRDGRPVWLVNEVQRSELVKFVEWASGSLSDRNVNGFWDGVLAQRESDSDIEPEEQVWIYDPNGGTAFITAATFRLATFRGYGVGGPYLISLADANAGYGTADISKWMRIFGNPAAPKPFIADIVTTTALNNGSSALTIVANSPPGDFESSIDIVITDADNSITAGKIRFSVFDPTSPDVNSIVDVNLTSGTGTHTYTTSGAWSDITLLTAVGIVGAGAGDTIQIRITQYPAGAMRTSGGHKYFANVATTTAPPSSDWTEFDSGKFQGGYHDECTYGLGDWVQEIRPLFAILHFATSFSRDAAPVYFGTDGVTIGLNLPDATETFAGFFSTGNQALEGNKYLNGSWILENARYTDAPTASLTVDAGGLQGADGISLYGTSQTWSLSATDGSIINSNRPPSLGDPFIRDVVWTAGDGRPAPSADNWLSFVVYVIGDLVNKGGRNFESVTNGNVGNDPLTDDGTNWISYAPGGAVSIALQAEKSRVVIVGGLAVREGAAGPTVDGISDTDSIGNVFVNGVLTVIGTGGSGSETLALLGGF